jgi:hypothetical protein
MAARRNNAMDARQMRPARIDFENLDMIPFRADARGLTEKAGAPMSSRPD